MENIGLSYNGIQYSSTLNKMTCGMNEAPLPFTLIIASNWLVRFKVRSSTFTNHPHCLQMNSKLSMVNESKGRPLINIHPLKRDMFVSIVFSVYQVMVSTQLHLLLQEWSLYWLHLRLLSMRNKRMVLYLHQMGKNGNESKATFLGNGNGRFSKLLMRLNPVHLMALSHLFEEISGSFVLFLNSFSEAAGFDQGFSILEVASWICHSEGWFGFIVELSKGGESCFL